MKWINRFQNFMRERYGIDELYIFLLFCYLLISIIHLFFTHWTLSALSFAIFIIMFYRVFSKNIVMRQKENEWYLSCKRKVMKPFQNLKQRYHDRDTYIYKKCHACKTTLRLPLPSERGIKHVRCPKCKKRLTVLCFRKEKIEIFTKDGKRKYS